MCDWSDGFSRKTFLFQFIRPGKAHFGKSDLLCQNLYLDFTRFDKSKVFVSIT